MNQPTMDEGNVPSPLYFLLSFLLTLSKPKHEGKQKKQRGNKIQDGFGVAYMADLMADDMSITLPLELYIMTFELDTSDRTISRPVVSPTKNGGQPFCLLAHIKFIVISPTSQAIYMLI